MTVRTPLYYHQDGSTTQPILQEMTTLQIDQIRDAFRHYYIESPSVALTVVGSGGSLGNMIDTRLIAGAYASGTATFPGEVDTQEPQMTQVSFSRITQTVANIAVPSNANSVDYPIYYGVSAAGIPEIKSMTLQDVLDTFIADPDTSAYRSYILDGSTTEVLTPEEIYIISTSAGVAGYTEVSGSSTPIFTDTRADPAGYNAAEIPEIEDSTTTQVIQNYYLHKKIHTTPAYTTPAKLTPTGNIILPDAASWKTTFQNVMRYAIANVSGLKLRYSINGAGTTCGSAMTDTRLSGSGNYQTQQVGGDDYRAQEFPDGSPVTIDTYTLKVQKS